MNESACSDAKTTHYLMLWIQAGCTQICSANSLDLFDCRKTWLINQRIKIAYNLIQNSYTGFAILNVFRIEILEVRYRCKHHAA